MGRSLVVIALALVGLLSAAGMGYAAYVVSRDSVAVPVTKLQQTPQQLTPNRVREHAQPKQPSRPPTAPATTRTTATTPTTTGDDHGGRSPGGSGSGSGGGSGSGRGGGDDDRSGGGGHGSDD
jgi:uncharacterized membrane protein YgcG